MRRRAALAAAAGLLGLPGCTGFEGPSAEEDGDGPADDETGTNDGNETNDPVENNELNEDPSGPIEIEVDGERVDLSADRFQAEAGEAAIYLPSDGTRWAPYRSDVPFADALSELPAIEYERDEGWRVLTVDGTSYSEGDEGTETAFSVDDDLVDPEEYVLEENDALAVEVSTDGARDRDAPAGGVDASGPIGVYVDGERFDLTRDRFQSEHVDDEALAFHLHEGDERWYSEGDEHVTVGEGLDLLPDVAYDRADGYHRLELVDDVYDERDAGTEIAVRVDGELVDPTAYEVGDGESILVLVTTGR